MTSLSGSFGTVIDLLIVVLGFSLIIVVHELGHFIAARWAGVRVLAFAVGFGPAAVSYRKGLGVRLGSSPAPAAARSAGPAHKAAPLTPGRSGSGQISPTEYRLNWLPFGGYVKMLGQDDADPSARSDDPDSYQSVPVWKRMIIISAGVVMNLLLAAALFIAVFLIGLRTEPAKVGGVTPGGPAARAVASNGSGPMVTEPGLKAGDRILSIDGRPQNTFHDVVLATAMSREGRPMEMLVERPGVGQVRFRVEPRRGPENLLMIGVLPAVSPTLIDSRRQDERVEIAARLDSLGLEALAPGMTLVGIGAQEGARRVSSFEDLRIAARESGGSPLSATFESEAGNGVVVDLTPVAEVQSARFALDRGSLRVGEHLVGLTGVMSVRETLKSGEQKGLFAGDVFARIGGRAWPSYVEGVQEIQARAGKTIRVVVARRGAPDSSEWTTVDLGDIEVSRAGTIGFGVARLGESEPRLSSWPEFPLAPGDDIRPPAGPAWSGSTLPILAGSRILTVDGTEVRTFADVREALRRAADARADRDSSLRVWLGIELPLEGVLSADSRPVRPTETVEWTIPAAEVVALRTLSWHPPIDESLFEPERFLDRASGPAGAIVKGVRETHRVMMSTYLTFARLIQGSVKIEHLKGPVGIAHTGTLIASKGFIWLLFFMALISVNLAVINFLPIPIADGGHFVFLLYEQLTGRPPSVGVQNAAAVVGLVILGGLFIIVTINDIGNLF